MTLLSLSDSTTKEEQAGTGLVTELTRYIEGQRQGVETTKLRTSPWECSLLAHLKGLSRGESEMVGSQTVILGSKAPTIGGADGRRARLLQPAGVVIGSLICEQMQFSCV